MTKRRKTKSACHACFSIWLFFLLSADTPFISVHRTGFSGVKLINQEVVEPMNRLCVLVAGWVAALILPTLVMAAPDRTHPKLAYDPGLNRVLVVYESLTDIYGQFRSADGTALNFEFVISNGGGTQQQVAVAFDTTNRRFLVVWRDGRNALTTGEDIYGQILSADGFPSGGNFAISNAAGNQVAPSVAFDAVNQGFLVVWRDARNAGTTGQDIYGQLVNVNGSLSGGNFFISTAAGDQVAPHVAYDTIKQLFFAVWQDGRNTVTTGEDIYGQLINADGSLSGDDVVLSDATGDQVAPFVAYGITNQRFFVAWQDGRNAVTTGEDIYGQIFNPNKSLSGDDIVISDAAGNQVAPSVAYDIANQRFLVVWRDGRNTVTTGDDIYGQLVNADGSLYQTVSNVNFVISEALNDQDFPSATSPSNCANYLVSFQTEETGDPELGFAPIGDPCRETYNTVTLIHPNGGEIIPSGSTYPIHWGAPEEATSFEIEYSTGGSWKTIAEGVTGTGYLWHVPDPQGDKEEIRVRVTGYNLFYKKVGRDRSNGKFDIKVARVTSPVGVEELISDDPTLFPITWDTYVTDRPVARVEIYFIKNGGTGGKRIGLIKGTNPGSFSWRIPIVEQPKNRCRIKVVLKDAAGRKLGTDITPDFTINPLPTP
jgi:hypothetical protein